MTRFLLYLAYLGTLFVVVDAALSWRYLRATRIPLPRKAFFASLRHVPERTLLRLGWLDAGHDSSFIHFDRKKRKGVVRVGCMGDSFTYGTEVNRTEDYPTILQGLFRARGYPQVEVINFGSGWFGFQQAFTLWDDVARGFDLDYVLLGPKTFFFQRDTTFDHGSPSTTYYLHARHVLDGDGLRLVEVVGDTFQNRTAAYRRFIPYWRYLRYDRRAPVFLASLVPGGRQLMNPFYYRRDIDGELSEVYRRQLRRMADSGAQVVLGHYDENVGEYGRALDRGNVLLAKFEQVQRYPYGAPKGHDSPAGNRLLAEQFFALLTGRRQVVLPMIAVKPLKEPAPPAAGGAPRSLEAFARVSVGLEDGEPWRFVEIMNGMNSRDLPGDFIRRFNAESLIAIRASEQLLPEAAFYPLPVEIREGMELSLRSPQGEIVLGKVSLLRPDLQVGVVDLSGALRVTHPAFNEINAVYTAERALKRLLPGKVYLGGHALFQMGRPNQNGQVSLQPLRRRFLQIYPPPELLGQGSAGRTGLLTLRFESKRGAAVSVPLASWKRTRKDHNTDFPAPIPHPIRTTR